MAQSNSNVGPASNPNNDVMINTPPEDTVSQLDFSPSSSYSSMLAASSWDCVVRGWDVDKSTGNTMPKFMYQHEGPALSVSWFGDGTKLFSGGCDKVAKMYDLNTGQSTNVAQHEAPVRCVKAFDQYLITGSWDRSVKIWDLRSPQPTSVFPQNERVYSLDIFGTTMAVATADRHVAVYDLRQGGAAQPYILETTLKFQSKCIAVFPSGNGYAVGSIEGRVAIQYIDVPSDDKKNFSFKCHRTDKEIYSVNALSFHSTYQTFSTAGSDGNIHFWDKDSRQRLKQFAKMPQPITSTAFNDDGSIFAYAIGYDWAKGVAGSLPSNTPNIFLHGVIQEEIHPKPAPGPSSQPSRTNYTGRR